MTRILYLAGAGRSGSTLLGMILGQLPQFFNVGEIKWFWSDVSEGKRLCSCREQIRQCPFWKDVVRDLEGQGLNISRIATTLMPRLTRSIHLPRILAGHLGGRAAAEWQEFREATARLYEAVGRRCSGRIIVDGSKLPPQLILLNELPGLDLRLLHLVRDGRGVAYAWQKRWQDSKRTEKRTKKDYRVTSRQAPKAVLIWSLQNLLIERLAAGLAHRTLIRYEDFVDSPRTILERALRDLGWGSSLPLLASKEIELHPTHALAGSHRVRFAEPKRRIVLDDEWRRGMSPRKLLILSIMGLYCLRRYGYRIHLSDGVSSTLGLKPKA